MKSYEPEYFKKYYVENKERYKENHKKWLEENKDYWNAYQRKQSKLRWWRNKLKADPNNEEIIKKIKTILDEYPKK